MILAILPLQEVVNTVASNEAWPKGKRHRTAHGPASLGDTYHTRSLQIVGRNPLWIKPRPTKDPSGTESPPARGAPSMALVDKLIHPGGGVLPWRTSFPSSASFRAFLNLPAPSSVERSFSAAARKFPAGHINARAAGGGGGPRLSLLFPVITRHRRRGSRNFPRDRCVIPPSPALGWPNLFRKFP